MKTFFLSFSLLFAVSLSAQTVEDTTGQFLFWQFIEEKSPANFELQLEQILAIKNTQPQSFIGTRNSSMIYSLLVRKYVEAGMYGKVERYADSVLPNSNRTALLLESAQAILKNEKSSVTDLHYAKKFAKTAVEERKKEMVERAQSSANTIVEERKKEMAERAQSSANAMYAMYADTYVNVLMKLNEYNEAYPYAKEAATFTEMKEMGYTERYALLLAKTQPVSVSKPELEKLMSEGLLTANAKEALKEVYKKEHNSLKGYDAYIAKYEAASSALREKELAKELVNTPAPSFTLKDVKGKTVSLNKLKGKTVILDFWATWCNPCIKLFPAMQKTIDRHKNNPNVVFLFVNTQERGTPEERLQKVKAFFGKEAFEKYTFNVVMDADNSVAKSYGIKGIPAKFVIDPKGNIRFNSVGNTEREEATIETLSLMIKMASKM